MKRTFKSKAPKLILTCFVITLTYVIFYELIFSNCPSCCDFVYKLGIITSRLFYSIIAASIFYYLSQYIPVFLPKEERRVKILFNIYQRVIIIDAIISEFKNNLNINNIDFTNTKTLDNVLKTIILTEPVAEFENWYLYLFHLKSRLLEVIRSIIAYNDYVSNDLLHELLKIEEIMFSPYTFVGYMALSSKDLSSARSDIYGVLVHNKQLQNLKVLEFKEYEKIFNLDEAEYKKKYYQKNS